jgi:hypothetical protein
VESKKQELWLYEYKDYVYNHQKLTSEKDEG